MDPLAEAKALVHRSDPWESYLAIRDRQMAIGEWSGPILTSEQQYILQKWDLYIKRF